VSLHRIIAYLCGFSARRDLGYRDDGLVVEFMDGFAFGNPVPVLQRYPPCLPREPWFVSRRINVMRAFDLGY
jgi:hypothetical protein